MWSDDQRRRMVLEHQILQREGFDQFSVYYDKSDDLYWALGTASANSGHKYRLYIPLPSAYPYQRPEMYVTDPNPLRMFNGSALTSLGVSHQMHTLTPHANGWPQICHWRDTRWHSAYYCTRFFSRAHLD